METLDNIYDIHFKDEGDFTTAIFLTEKAQETLKADNAYKDNKELFYGIEVLKIDIDNSAVTNLLGWAMTHRLRVKSEVSIKV